MSQPPASNQKPVTKIHASDLPLSCPPSSNNSDKHPDNLWNAHPRVFLPISEANKSATCPYCSAQYVLEN